MTISISYKGNGGSIRGGDGINSKSSTLGDIDDSIVNDFMLIDTYVVSLEYLGLNSVIQIKSSYYDSIKEANENIKILKEDLISKGGLFITYKEGDVTHAFFPMNRIRFLFSKVVAPTERLFAIPF